MITAGLLKQHLKKVARYLDYVQPFFFLVRREDETLAGEERKRRLSRGASRLLARRISRGH